MHGQTLLTLEPIFKSNSSSFNVFEEELNFGSNTKMCERHKTTNFSLSKHLTVNNIYLIYLWYIYLIYRWYIFLLEIGFLILCFFPFPSCQSVATCSLLHFVLLENLYSKANKDTPHFSHRTNLLRINLSWVYDTPLSTTSPRKCRKIQCHSNQNKKNPKLNQAHVRLKK